MQVAILGGSSVATVQLAEAVAQQSETGEWDSPLRFALHGRSTLKLEAVADRFRHVAGAAVTVLASTEMRSVLEGADVVLLQMRIGGLAGRSFDESFPWRAGLPGEETLGPGGFGSCLRTLPALEPVWEALRTHCPDALVVVLTNPAGLVRQAAAAHGLKAVEVCDSPVAFLQKVAMRLEVSLAEAARRYVGMNHVGWYVPDTEGDLERLCTDQWVGPEVIRAHRAVPLGYVRYYLEPDVIYCEQQGKPTRAEHLMANEAAARDRLAQGQSPDGTRRPAPWYGLGVLPVLSALANGSDELMLLGSANGSRVAGLPAEATVEGLASLDQSGAVQPAELAELPPLPGLLLQRHAIYEQLALAAAGDPTRKNVLAALLANPMVATARQASLLTDVLLGQGASCHE